MRKNLIRVIFGTFIHFRNEFISNTGKLFIFVYVSFVSTNITSPTANTYASIGVIDAWLANPSWVSSSLISGFIYTVLYNI